MWHSEDQIIPWLFKGIVVWPWQVQNTWIYPYLWQSTDREQFIEATSPALYWILPCPLDYNEWDFFGIKAFNDMFIEEYYTTPWDILPSTTTAYLWAESISLSADASAIWVNNWTNWVLWASNFNLIPYKKYNTSWLPTPPVAWSPVNLPLDIEKYIILTSHPTTSNIILPQIPIVSGVVDYPLYLVNRDLQIQNLTNNTYIINTLRTDMLYPMNILPWQTLFFKSNKNSNAVSRTLISPPNPLKLSVSVANSTTALADVTWLWVALQNNRSYYFKYFITYTSTATGTGSVWSLNWPVGTIHYTSERSNTSTTDANVSGQWYNSVVWLSAWSATTTSNVCIIEWVITPTAPWTLIPRFASEVAGSAITALANFSYLELKRL